MLSQILREFRQSGGAVSLSELSRKLGVERTALDGMLETLVRQGKIRQVCAGDGAGCPGSKRCHCRKGAGNALRKSYELV